MNKVQTGDPIQIRASTWNSFIDAAEYVKNLQADQSGGALKNGVHNGVVLLKNEEGILFSRFSAMVITDVLIRPDANEMEFAGKCPAFIGRKMTDAYEGYPYAVLLEPIDAGKIGHALLLGVTPALVSILDPEHKFAEPVSSSATGALQSAENGVARILWKAGDSGSQWCMLQLGGAGSGGGGTQDDRVILCKITGGNAQSGFSVSLFPNGKDQPSTGNGVLFAVELAVNAKLPAGSWVLGHKHMIAITGGNET